MSVASEMCVAWLLEHGYGVCEAVRLPGDDGEEFLADAIAEKSGSLIGIMHNARLQGTALISAGCYLRRFVDQVYVTIQGGASKPFVDSCRDYGLGILLVRPADGWKFVSLRPIVESPDMTRRADTLRAMSRLGKRMPNESMSRAAEA